MPHCNKPITRTTRSGETITPTLSYRCEVNIPEGEVAHEGPCANPSDSVSRDARIHWQRTSARKSELDRHASSGLGQTQSIPLTSAFIVEGETNEERNNPALKVARTHPSAPVDCPFCNQQPMQKDLLRHIQTDHINVSEEVPSEPPSPEKSRYTAPLSGFVPSQAVPFPIFPAPEVHESSDDQDFLDAALVSAWFSRSSAVPKTVRDAWERLSRSIS